MNETQDRNWLGDADDDVYKENILDHYRHPHNYGEMSNPTFSAREINPLCGDNLEMSVELRENKIEDIKFRGSGCAVSMASASMLTQKVKGMTLEEAKRITDKDIFEIIGIRLGVVRAKCGLLGLKALLKGADEYDKSKK